MILTFQWKAAKEELLEDEEEPQTAYEILERKRQKEIEVGSTHILCFLIIRSIINDIGP